MRRMQQIQNSIVATLGQLGIRADDIDFVQGFALKKVPAQMNWYADGYFCHISCNKGNSLVDNFALILELLKQEVADVLAGALQEEEFYAKYEEDEDIYEQQRAARNYFGLESDHFDFDEVVRRYKEKSKQLHPDMPQGDVDKFKELNKYHKILKKELE